MKPEILRNYTQPTRGGITSWNPTKVRQALRSLELGQFGSATYLWDAILADDRAQGVISTFTRGMLALPTIFAGADETSQAVTAKEDLEADYWTMLPEDARDELYTYALGLGAAPAQLVYERKNGRWLPTLEPWHPSHLRYDDSKGEWSILTKEGYEILEPGNGKWVLLTPGGIRRYWVKALIRALAIPWLAKQYAVLDWQRFSEKYGTGVKVGNVPLQANPEDKAAFRDDLFDLASNPTILVPEGFDFKLVEAASHNADAFEKLIAWADTAMSIAVLGQNLTTEVSGGSFAAATVHRNVEQDRLKWLAETVSTTERAQITKHWAIFNYANEDLAPWAKQDTEPPPEDGKIYEYHLKAPIIKVNELRQKSGLPPLSDEEGGNDFVVINDQPAQQQPTSLSANKITLASGDKPAQAKGLIQGQIYTDTVVDKTHAANHGAFAEFLGEVNNLVNSAEDYDDLRRKLAGVLDGKGLPDSVAENIMNAMIMSYLSGQHSVNLDV